jgi:hypothetical protein
MSRVFICSWDCNGFEAIVDMTSWERQCLLDTIVGKELSKPPVSLNMLMLRAQFNPQRNPEIWTFNAEDELTEEALREYAKTEPQALVDLIRESGKCLYGTVKIKNPVIQ